MQKQTIGILGIQGGFSKHQQVVQDLGFATIIVKTVADLKKSDKLIMPGGESTTMRLLLKKHQLWDELKKFCQTKQVFGTCAGAILLAKNIDAKNADEDSLEAIDITIMRNSYGRQIDSFETMLDVDLNGQIVTVPSMFIRAPQIGTVGPGVKILATYNNMPVLVQAGLVLAATFHPELTGDNTICNYFLNHL